MASGLTKDTTAVAGSTLVTPAVESTVTRIVSPLAGEIDSTRAGRSRSVGKIRVSKAHQV